MRKFLNNRGYLEVETPILQPIYGGASARPFKTHHNSLDMTLYLRIANELYLKRLIVGGFEGVFEFAKDFRNEGMDEFHNPEFTQMELYVAYKDYFWMMELTEEMISTISKEVLGTTKITFNENDVDLAPPWRRLPLYEGIQEFTGLDISESNEEELREAMKTIFDQTLVFNINNKIDGNRLLNTQQPVELAERCIELLVPLHEIVLDPFVGSGTSLIACYNTSRYSYSMDILEKNVQIAVERFVEYSGNPKIQINGVEVDWYEYNEANSFEV